MEKRALVYPGRITRSSYLASDQTPMRKMGIITPWNSFAEGIVGNNADFATSI